MVSPVEVIAHKREGSELDTESIRAFVSGIADESVSDAQIAALCMAIYLNGMTEKEQATLTLAMRDSGQVLEWPDLDGPVLDKHSTGGVGDLVSLVLGPMVAACGAYIPMISGRGLGHTGGTLDKLESIPGLSVRLDQETLRRTVREVGLVMVGQGAYLAPADRRMYAVRDVTATVDSVPLIVASILCKKLSEGLDGLVMDIKTGNGAFMRESADAERLALDICGVAARAGLPCSAVITDMNQPLARSTGNALEVTEAVAFLTGGPRCERLERVVFALGQELLELGALADGKGQAREMLSGTLESGRAAERFARMVAAQGGPRDLLENPHRHLPAAPLVKPLRATRTGYVHAIDTREVGRCVHDLGGGRHDVGDTIDERVGLTDLCRVGDRIEKGQVLAAIHAAGESGWERAAVRLRHAIVIEQDEADALPAVYGRVELMTT